MTILRRFLALLTPSPFAGIVAMVAALAVGYLLWVELEPTPRHVVAFDSSSWRRMSFSPDGKSIVFGLETADPQADELLRITFSILDLDANKERLLAETTDRLIAFAPDGKRVAGIRQDTVYVWDRETGAEQERYRLTTLKRKDFDRRLAFMPEGLILGDWSEINNAEAHISLDGSKPWKGAKKVFDQISDAQQLLQLTNRFATDGNHSVSEGKAGFIVSDWRDNSSKVIPCPSRFESTTNAAISSDAKTLILHGKVWRPLQTAIESIRWVYSQAKEPAATEGVLLLDVESGDEIAFLQSRSQFGIPSGLAPDSKSFITMNRTEGMLSIYDWPLAKPWWSILGGALLAFVTLALVGKAWRWLRGTPKPSDEDARPSRPPWEMEPTPSD